MKRLIDTDVVIDYLRGNDKAVKFFEESVEPFCLSAVTVAELYAGVKGADEEAKLDNFLNAHAILEIDRPKAKRAGLLFKTYHQSHGTGIIDALIAAAAEASGSELVTLNKKHFPMLKDVFVPYKKT
ncbi:MAG: type II toxin-antitoxin system VapC family toxin [Planctomycetes bacterium]|nr:type II toxin-antitoxin system VapC family toxin [Planctomycetota bacterium]